MVIKNVRESNGQVLIEMLDHLREEAQGSTAITVQVLPATDHDGVCSAKLFDLLLHRSGVMATMVPVTGNTDIIAHISQFDSDDTVKSLVLLNCGASLDIQRTLEESNAPRDLRCFIIDSHRPLLLANCKDKNERVYVLDDDPIVDASVRPTVDDDSPSEASDEEKENEWDFTDGNPRATGEDGREQKRRRLADKERRRERRRQEVNQYYLNSYTAMPAAMSLFRMARLDKNPSPDLLWLAAVSLAGYHDLGLLGEVEYGRLADPELNDVLMGVDDFSGLLGSQTSAGRSAGGASDDEGRPTQRSTRSRGMQQQQQQSLRFERELRLNLFKHWNLQESAMHSPYFYGTLELHRDKGLRALKNFFATTGIAPAQYTQQYKGMEAPVRKMLNRRFSENGKNYGLNDKMFLQQFVRDLGNLGEGFAALNLNEISAVDGVHILTALLSSIPPRLGNAQIEALPKTADGRRDAAAVHEMERQAMVQNFWRAGDAILCRDPNLIRDGIAEAVDVCKKVTIMARFLIDTKALRLSASHQFRWCKIEQPPNHFRHHLTVRRLAMWLLQVLFAYRPKSDGPEKPLLLMVRDHVRDTYLCVGASPTNMCDQNEFGERFRAVLRTDKTLKYRYDFFDKSCIDIAAEDFDRFWDAMVDTVA
jgi:cell division control protein 45